ncbi:S-adenosylmethionine uptake transporter [Sphaerotilus hippei]|uniref:S-adenosylmethionine uptake transporter n=1 Tax=Sphaerotilus hippei TaxID=744406 RepID=A0A318H141_9BURK|nr:DMT family transporter [Sphaerotilus hippei]PXW94205.1 S-adenosylmethionine uptake transporter [Sphaerotilus hippei]
MSAPLMMVLATLLFACMGVCVKLAAVHYDTGEIVMYRGLVGALMMAALSRQRGESLATTVPGMHLWRSLVGVSALCLWFYAIGGLPLPTAMTLNYMSSVWMAMFLIGGAILMGGARIDWRLIVTVLAGFVGVALILRPTIAQSQLWYGLVGLLSGMLSALAYLQVTALGRLGEPESRVVFYFSCGGLSVGLVLTLIVGELHAHTLRGGLLLLATGLFATAAQVLMTKAYATGRPLVNASLQYLGIVHSFVFSVLLFDDPVHWMSALGMVIIIGAGIAAASLRQGAGPAASRSTLAPDIEP